ncbi:hypothetical protein PRZ48_003699 [Zasmidium cellare]|uniref:Uncharacterized protein n=1 Tax=Zasmidium cellare TaxID=395010 RepID=A0ABR0EVT9_ZASCE|nr:hypothetical protein PRZ48_003699 [Zasmidium cellare]
MQFQVLLALAATLGVALSAPADGLNQRGMAVTREEASPAENTMYYDEDFDEAAVKREEASPAENTM